MTRREKVGLGVLVGLFALFGAVLWWTIRPPGPASHSPEESIFVRQRVEILQQKGENP